MVQVVAQPADIWTGHQFTSNGRPGATITYLGKEDNKHKYRVTAGSNDRCLAVTDGDWEVVTYHKKKGQQKCHSLE